MMKVIKITKDGDEITRYGFISQLEHYIKQLLSDPIHANVGDYLSSHGIDGPGILPMLLHNPDASDENNAILIRTERIKTNPETGKDQFYVKYKMPRKDYDKKMRKLYIDLFENYQTDYDLLNEEGECCACGDGGACGGESAGIGGSTSCSSSGQYVQPLFGKKKKKSEGGTSDSIIRRDMPGMLSEKKKKTLYITESQLETLREEAVMNTPIGNFGYDAPALVKKGDPTLDHKDMMRKSFPGYKKNKIEENIGSLDAGSIARAGRKVGNFLTKAAMAPFSLQSCSSDFEPTQNSPYVNKKDEQQLFYIQNKTRLEKLDPSHEGIVYDKWYKTSTSCGNRFYLEIMLNQENRKNYNYNGYIPREIIGVAINFTDKDTDIIELVNKYKNVNKGDVIDFTELKDYITLI